MRLVEPLFSCNYPPLDVKLQCCKARSIYFINGLFIDGLLFKNTILIVSDTSKHNVSDKKLI